MINWTHVLGTHVPELMILGIFILFAQIVHQVVTELTPGEFSLKTVIVVAIATKDLILGFIHSLYEADGFNMFSPAVKITALILAIVAWIIRMDNPVYLLSFATFKAPESWKCSQDEIVKMMINQKCFTDDSIEFMRRILKQSGTGQATAWPPGITKSLKGEKADRSIEASRKEAEIVLFDVVEQALKKAKVHPKEIDVLVINCSLFSPTPSLCAMVASKFGMRSDLLTYNLGGMGCSASLISIDLAKQLLQAKRGLRGGKALVVSTEIITPNLYHGNDRAFLIQNTLFRCGGAAMVLSNSWYDGRRAWYKLLHTVRVQGTGPESYECVYEAEDNEGERGVRLSKDIVKVAGKCMEKNFTMLGPLVLPLTEQLKVVLSLVARFVCKFLTRVLRAHKMENVAKNIPLVKPYVPDFKRAIDHFCIHAGGRAVIDGKFLRCSILNSIYCLYGYLLMNTSGKLGIEKNMKLELYHTEPSRMALLNYGNTSSSSIWYELEYIHEQQKTNPLKKGDRVLQVAFGSGFKCTSGVWLKL
jgi:predicted naringenin-chalcone synthase